jgi:hypothetical protein
MSAEETGGRPVPEVIAAIVIQTPLAAAGKL